MKFFTIKNLLLYAAAMAAMLLLLRLMQFKLMVIDHALEIYILGIAILFTFIGMWLATKLTPPKTQIIKEKVLVEKEVPAYRQPYEAFQPNAAIIEKSGLSPREIEVLQLMATGATNQEIADRLFVSLNTIKTHTSRIFEKLDVKRRTQAIEKARKLHIIV